jgi:hypothetical protein
MTVGGAHADQADEQRRPDPARPGAADGRFVTSDVAYPGLWACYTAFMKAALALIRKYEIESDERPNAFWLVVRVFEPLQKPPEFQALHAHMLSSSEGESAFVDAGNNPIREPGAQAHWLMNLYMMPVLVAYIGPELMLDFDERLAKAVYAELEASLECKQAVYAVLAPLQHFEGPDEEIRLDATLVLRKLGQDEREYLWHLGEFGGMVDRSQAPSISFCLAASLVTEKNVPTKLSEVRGSVMRVVTALRLLKSGQVGVPIVTQRLREPAFGLPGGTVAISGAPAALGPSYTLLLEESESLVATYQALARAAGARGLQLALRRFNYAYDRMRPDDKLIDYWIALETLFLPDERRQELSYRASLRVAWYVGQGPSEREEIFRQIRDSYDARSDIVHGKEPKGVSKVAQFTEDVLRRALDKAVLMPGSLDAKQLDQLIVRGSSCVESADDSLDPPA